MLLSIVSFVLLNIALLHYFSKLKQNKAPKNPIFLKSAMAISSLSSVGAISTLFLTPTSVISTVFIIVIALYVLSTSAVFTFFLAQKDTPIGDIKIAVGDDLLAFKTETFDSSSLAGKRTLLKFYRGAWCPYCSAELVMFEALKPQLDQYNIQIVGISNDTIEQQKVHKVRDNISHTLVSDPELNVIRQYGVEHHKALGATSDELINIFGMSMPLPWKMKYKPMSIPTSILIDENCKILWIDQSEDYRLRASEDAVMGAVTANFAKD
ncbi:peroxiredoxin family protein [Vibrio sp. F74]|uniref:peroxiredoxin family protein n=1 Tax=Vibrio sp. F74 TaxID=700020 RepID=UPI0035F5F2B2